MKRVLLVAAWVAILAGLDMSPLKGAEPAVRTIRVKSDEKSKLELLSMEGGGIKVRFTNLSGDAVKLLPDQGCFEGNGQKGWEAIEPAGWRCVFGVLPQDPANFVVAPGATVELAISPWMPELRDGKHGLIRFSLFFLNEGSSLETGLTKVTSQPRKPGELFPARHPGPTKSELPGTPG